MMIKDSLALLTILVMIGFFLFIGVALDNISILGISAETVRRIGFGLGMMIPVWLPGGICLILTLMGADKTYDLGM